MSTQIVKYYAKNKEKVRGMKPIQLTPFPERRLPHRTRTYIRCNPVMLVQVLSTAAPPTLDCLLGTVLPAVVTRISSHHGTSSGSTRNRDTAAVHAICRLAASVAASPKTTRGGEEDGGPDPVQFRRKVSGSELRKLGPLGREAEVALAEAFFYREAEGAII